MVSGSLPTWDKHEALLAFGFAPDVQHVRRIALAQSTSLAASPSSVNRNRAGTAACMLNSVVLAPSWSRTLAAMTTNTMSRTRVSVTMNGLRPLIRFAAS